jgi:hopanoid C-3 methylase
MKILLVNPPNCGRSIPEEEYGIDSFKEMLRAEPLSLEALAGNLEDHQVRIIDLKAVPDGYGDMLDDFAPDIVGITGVTCEANTVVKLATRAKQTGGPLVVVGGIHASSDPDFFNRDEIDYIVVGLGKASFRELVEVLALGHRDVPIPGVAATRPGKPLSLTARVCSRQDLVEEKAPRYDLVDDYRSHYMLKGFGFSLGLVSTAFGCPHRCSFCCIGNTTGGRYLVCDPDAIIRDMSLINGTSVIRLVDANTFGDIKLAWALCRKIQEADIKKQYIADVRSDTVVRNPDLFREWSKTGLRSVIIGFEEIDDGQLKAINKSNTTAVNTEAISILHDMGITIVGDFIVSPDYDESRFQALRDYIETHAVDLPMPSILTPLPGTDLYKAMEKKIVIHDLDYYTLTNAVIPTRMEEKAFYQHFADLVKRSHQGARI